MHTWLLLLWDRVRASFWFVPMMMALGAVVLAATLLTIDRYYTFTFTEAWGWLGVGELESVRTLLSTLVGATITAMSVVFSVTTVALTLTVTQLGPRLLRNFLRDRGAQVTLGTFMATALYCLLVLWMAGRVKDEPVPHMASMGALVLAVASLGMLIYFVHHVAQMIQAPNVILAVSRELEEAIDTCFPHPIGEKEPTEHVTGSPADPAPPAVPAPTPGGGGAGRGQEVRSRANNYVQAVDLPSLLRLADDRDVVIWLHQRPGRFVVEGEPLAVVWPAERVNDRTAALIRKAFVFGANRTPTQDPEFAIEELVEVALRALSPALNDTHTAVNCVDRLGSALTRITQRKMPPREQYGHTCRLRVLLNQSTYSGLVSAAIDQVRQAARGNAAVLIRLLEALTTVARHTTTEPRRQVLWHQAEMIHRNAMASLSEACDRQDLIRRFEQVARALGRVMETGSDLHADTASGDHDGPA